MKIIPFILLFISLHTYGQTKNKKSNSPQKISCYLPSGEKCPDDKVGINMFTTNRNFESKSRTWFATPNQGRFKFKCSVVFKSFTKTPLYITPNEHEIYTKEDIDEIMNDLSYSYYFGVNNSGFKADLKKYIVEKKLTDIFLLETIGKPSRSKESYTNGKEVRFMEYDEFGVRIWLINGYAYSYDEI